MTSRRDEATRLLLAVQAEHALPVPDRATRATDDDLMRVVGLLRQAAEAGSSSERQALRGHISRTVVDIWSFEAPLSDALVAFDDRFLAP